MSSVTITAPGGEGFFTQDWYRTLVGRLYDSTEYLGQMEQYNVSVRTPTDTGALMADVSYEPNHDPNNPELVFVYSDTVNQEDAWGRVYELYQEGGALGLSTYTNDPHEMYASILTDDVPAIEKWGTDALQGGLDSLAAGSGVQA